MPRGSEPDPVQEQLHEILSLLKSQGADIAETKKMLAESQARVSTLEKKVSVLERENKMLKENSNDRDQASRSRSIRLFGVPQSDEETKSADGGKAFYSKMYDKILKPCLNSAKTNGDLQSVPHFATAVESIYRSGKSAIASRPAPLVITFSNESYRMAVMRNKKLSLPSPTPQEKEAGIRRYMAVEDLTSANFNMLKQLKSREEVDKVWSIEGKLRFKLRGHDTVHKVKSVFDTLESIISVIK
jgi:hypothetical protein